MIRFFIDMDGTLNEWGGVALEELYEEGYFLTRPPHLNVIKAVEHLIDQGMQVYILSAVIKDSTYAVPEKNAWMDIFLPQIDEAHRVYVPHGDAKTKYVSGGLRPTDILLDDYTVNLNDWAVHGGTGVKLMNGVNGSNGTWQGAKVSIQSKPSTIVKKLSDVAEQAAVRCK